MPTFNFQCFQILEEGVHNDTGFALGRKNYLFAGSDAGGQRAAAMYSIIQTAKLKPYQGGNRIRFRSDDRLLAFLEAL